MKDFSNPDDYPPGTEVTVQFSGTLTEYLDHWGEREMQGSYVAWNGGEVHWRIKVPANSKVVQERESRQTDG